LKKQILSLEIKISELQAQKSEKTQLLSSTDSELQKIILSNETHCNFLQAQLQKFNNENKEIQEKIDSETKIYQILNESEEKQIQNLKIANQQKSLEISELEKFINEHQKTLENRENTLKSEHKKLSKFLNK